MRTNRAAQDRSILQAPTMTQRADSWRAIPASIGPRRASKARAICGTRCSYTSDDPNRDAPALRRPGWIGLCGSQSERTHIQILEPLYGRVPRSVKLTEPICVAHRVTHRMPRCAASTAHTIRRASEGGFTAHPPRFGCSRGYTGAGNTPNRCGPSLAARGRKRPRGGEVAGTRNAHRASTPQHPSITARWAYRRRRPPLPSARMDGARSAQQVKTRELPA